MAASPANRPNRPTAGGIVVSPEGKIALVCQNGDSWSFPKGGVEAKESPLEAAVREIREETGLSDLALVGELGTYERYSIGKGGRGEQTEGGLRKRTLFLFKTDKREMRGHDLDGEVTETRFTTLDEALSLVTHPKDREFLETHRDRIEALVNGRVGGN